MLRKRQVLFARRVAAPSGLTYSSNPATYIEDVAISSNTPSVTGSVASYSVSPSLPTGLTLDTTTGIITGTATDVTAQADYTITATGPGGSTQATLTLTVRAWAPTDMTGLIGWFKADTGVTLDGSSNVLTWADQSGAGNNLVQASAGTAPAMGTLNSQTAVAFGNNKYLRILNLAYDNYTVATVHKVTSAAKYVWDHRTNDTDARDYAYHSTGNTLDIRRGTDAVAKNLTANWGTDSANARTHVFMFGGTYASIKMRLNEVAQTLSDNDPGTPGSGTVTANWVLNGQHDGASSGTMTINELVILNRSLDAHADLAKLEAYLKAKFGHY